MERDDSVFPRARGQRRGRRRARRSPFYAKRRIPHQVSLIEPRLQLLPLLPQLALMGITGYISGSRFVPREWKKATQEYADSQGNAVSQRSQRIFFDNPGLDTIVIRRICKVASGMSTLGRAWLRAHIALGIDRDGRAEVMLPLIPRRGIEALMTWMLMSGTAIGLLRGGPVRTRLMFDSAVDQRIRPVPEGHSIPRLHRLEAPRTLTDLALDIDDLYWAGAYGQPVKITVVGEGENRRWLISLPGTDHIDMESTQNPADTEANIREVLGLPSSMRVGVLRALHEAMNIVGVSPGDYHREQALICGHSQGGMVAVALAHLSPQEAGVDVRGVLTAGAPARRFPIRSDVAMVAVEHAQDVIPSMDGTPARVPDHRVTVGRRLVAPRHNPLYYAHSSSTYTQTIRLLERQVEVTPYGRVADTVRALQGFLPQEDEETHVFYFDIWQELIEPQAGDRWDTFIRLDRPTVEAVDVDEVHYQQPLTRRS